jgi:AcrR family transcriptional regulator
MLADTDGFEAVSISSVARRLNVQPPSLYSHVRDRDALLDGVTELALSELGDAIGAAIAGRAGRDALVGLASAHRAYAQEHPGRWRAMQRKAGRAVAESADARRVVSLTTAVLRGYDLPEGEHVHAVRFLGGTLNGYLALERSGAFDHSTPSTDASWPRVIDALDTALRAWPVTSSPKGNAP